MCIPAPSIMAFAYLDSIGIPGDIIDAIAWTTHKLTLLPGLCNTPSFFERFTTRDLDIHDDALTRIKRAYGRDDVMLFTEGCAWFDICIIAFGGSNCFIMWFKNKTFGTTYLIEGEYDYVVDRFTVDRFYHKSHFEAPPCTNASQHAPFIHHGLNGTPFSILATVMGEGSMRCTMSMSNDSTFHWIDPVAVCSWFERQT